MQKWVVICSALLALVGAEECPDGGRCEAGQTCCNDPASGYECCPLDQAECCEDHMHCCPAGTVCSTATSSCLNATGSAPWVLRASAEHPGLPKSFRMIKAYAGEDDDNICPDQSQCPAEFSCLKALTKYGCCPLAQGVPCSDGKHCCPEGHQCSADCRSCIKKELVTTVLCGDGVSECPDDSTCCQTTDGKWACCPMPKAVCCEDKIHCCPEGTVCDVAHNKCASSATKKETPMWAKFPARIRADWENQKEGEQVTAVEFTTAGTVPPTEKDASPVTKAAAGIDVPCDGTATCSDNTTCCKNPDGGWSCCPLPEAVCCVDLIHCCPKGKTCNLVVQTCEGDDDSVPWVKKVPATPRQDAQVGDVVCDTTHHCPDGSTCCKTVAGDWACCGLPQAVCCDDHEHCCPTGTTCNLVTLTCDGPSGSTAMEQKTPAFTTEAPTTAQVALTAEDAPTRGQGKPEEEEEADYDEEDEENNEEEKPIPCDDHTSCPQSTTCCLMKPSNKWGCCPLPKAKCCADGNHCCPEGYECDVFKTTCTKGEVVIPWYTKLPADTGVQADPNAVKCEGQSQCPEQTTCCRLQSDEWGCCPIPNAVCCADKEHCCPQGYTCNMASNSCQKLLMLQLEAVPLTRVFLPERQPSKLRDVPCDDKTSCPDGNTCCRTSATTWGCCPFSNAVCCSDMQHCCPTGYTCTDTGDCTQNPGLHWHKWHVFFADKKRALIV